MGRPTIKDVAAAAGVSKATVSLVIRDSPQIPASTKQRVRDAMVAVGYVYNRTAAELRSHTSRTIGLIVANIRNPYFSELTMATEDAAREAGYTLLLGCSSDDVERQVEVVQAMSEHRVDGVILLPASHSTKADLDAALHGRSLPLVLVTREVAGFSSHYVGADNQAAGRVVGEHLQAIGARHVAFLGGVDGAIPRADRIRGLLTGLGDSITTLDLDLPVASDAGEGMDELVHQLLELGPLPDAIVAYNDMHAVGLQSALRARGIDPGHDVAIASFDNTPAAAQQFPPLTSVDGFPHEVGRIATQLLLRTANGTADTLEVRRIEPALEARGSTLLWRGLREATA